ncbi:MAG: dTMP kinase [Actinobacteria bacterium]|nr:dTMP kinase [Actinomycetota bacterium]
MVARRAFGLFVTFEGPEGGGKTTHSRRLYDRLLQAGLAAIWTHEPGGTAIGDAIRAILLDRNRLRKLNPRVQALLISAARAEHVSRVIRPALARGKVVVCDRYTDSTLAYQGGGFRVGARHLDSLNAFATSGLTPDLTVLVDIDVLTGLGRKFAGRRDNAAAVQAMEWKDTPFHQRVRGTYLALAAAEPARWLVVDGAAALEREARRVWERVESEARAHGLGPAGAQRQLL